jgi:ABC-type transport system involved in multi-copper enzyme maturation permease subunit
MRPVLLIAANFLREHRWPVILLFAWIILLALASADIGRQRAVAEDVMFYIVQQAIFICVFSAFLAADAIHNDRKSKRILLVLSKAVTRQQYLLAPILGTSAAAIGYAVLYGVCCLWLTDRAGLTGAGLLGIVLLVVAGSVLAATLALFFSTFLNPYAAVAATVLLFSAPGALHAQRHHWFLWLPGFPILAQMVNFRLAGEWTLNWRAIVLAALQAVFFWTAAAAIFSRRDIAVPVE